MFSVNQDDIVKQIDFGMHECPRNVEMSVFIYHMESI
jgi:hypothetical protein